MRVGSQSSVGSIVAKNYGMMSAELVRLLFTDTYDVQTVFEITSGVVRAHKWCRHLGM